MVAASAAMAGLLLLVGAGVVFRSSTRRSRLLGLAAVALAGLLVTATAAPDRAAAVAVTTISAATLTGLLLVALHLERASTRSDGQDLDLQQDPLRWG
ncbi:MAG: hypothetical protein ACNA8R_01745 [Nitriliruptoraceae bacterium]